MELLILSKLKWDLMAITAYDFLDHILERLQRSSCSATPEQQQQTKSCSTLQLEPSHLDSLRRHTERLVSLCATDAAFVEMPPSVVASAAVASALQQDFESQPPAGTAGLADIFERLRRLTRIEMVSKLKMQILSEQLYSFCISILGSLARLHRPDRGAFRLRIWPAGHNNRIDIIKRQPSQCVVRGLPQLSRQAFYIFRAKPAREQPPVVVPKDEEEGRTEWKQFFDTNWGF